MTAIPIERRIERFIVREPNSGCWLWTGDLHHKGYGRLRVGRNPSRKISGRTLFAHRVVYELHRGTIPDGLQLDHKCRNRCCVNPDHLEPVTNQENCRRGNTGKHLAERTHCPKGHPYSGDNLYLVKRRDKNRVNRMCKECMLASQAKRREKLRTKMAGG